MNKTKTLIVEYSIIVYIISKENIKTHIWPFIMSNMIIFYKHNIYICVHIFFHYHCWVQSFMISKCYFTYFVSNIRIKHKTQAPLKTTQGQYKSFKKTTR